MTFIVDNPGSFSLAGMKFVSGRRDTFFQQSFHLSNLAWVHSDGILQYAPMSCVTMGTRSERSPTWRHSLRAHVPEIVLCSNINQKLVVVKTELIAFKQKTLVLLRSFHIILVSIHFLDPFFPLLITHVSSTKVDVIHLK